MEIGNLFGNNQEPPKDLFLAIQIQEDLVKTALWEIQNGQPKVLNFGPVNNWADTESLLVSTDASLASALSDHQDLDVSRVIFGLPENWIKDDKISPDQAPLLKSLIEKLALKPIGFVTTTEAIIQFLKFQEGIPPTAIVLELNLSRVNLTVTRLGQIVGREEIARSEDLAKDVAEGLTRLNLQQLPARFVIINGSDSEAEQQLISYSWQDEFPFLHLPKVELPETHFSISAVAVAGGVEAARSLGLEVAPPEEITSPRNGEQPQVPTPTAPVVITDDSLSASDFGFVTQPESEPLPETPPDTLTQTPVNISSPLPRGVKPIYGAFISALRNFKFPRLSLPKVGPAIPLAIAAILLLALPATGFLAHQFFSSAQVTVFIKNSQITKAIQLSISDKPHPTLPTLNAAPDNIDLEKTDSITTTGETTVGDKAQGEVTIFNKSDTPKTLNKGTVLSTSTNLKFVLNDSVSIASRSSQVDANLVQTITPGKAVVPISASAIGADSNIGADTSLTVATYPISTLEAKANSSFKGGSSKTVQAVSKADQDKLLTQLTDSLKQEAAAKQSANSETQKVLAGSDLKITSKDFDKSVGEEATSLSLTLKAKVPLWRYQVADLNTLLTSALAADIPSGFILDPVATTISLDGVSTDKAGFVTASAQVNAHLTPNIPIDDFTKKLSGLSVAKAASLLENISGYQKAKITITPPIPYFAKFLPPSSSRIHLSITPTD